MDKQRRIGIYGGTFDPIHRIHIRIGRTALETLPLDEVHFVVAAQPPHKDCKDLTPVDLRFAMVDAALADEPGLVSSRIELDREGPSYTVDTLEAIHLRYPDAVLYLILGEDSVEDFPDWYAPDRILELVQLVVASRPGFETPAHRLKAPVLSLPIEASEMSSTALRTALEQGDDVDRWVPEAVIRIIREKELYGAHR